MLEVGCYPQEAHLLTLCLQFLYSDNWTRSKCMVWNVMMKAVFPSSERGGSQRNKPLTSWQCREPLHLQTETRYYSYGKAWLWMKTQGQAHQGNERVGILCWAWAWVGSLSPVCCRDSTDFQSTQWHLPPKNVELGTQRAGYCVEIPQGDKMRSCVKVRVLYEIHVAYTQGTVRLVLHGKFYSSANPSSVWYRISLCSLSKLSILPLQCLE